MHVRFEFFSKQICNVEALICHFYKNIKTLTQIHFPRDAHIFRTCTIFYRHYKGLHQMRKDLVLCALKSKKFHKTQVTTPFFHVDLLLSHVQCVHPANILQASRKDVASIHTSLASCEYYDWSVLAASILHTRFVPKIRMRKHSMRTNVRFQYVCCTFAACMLHTRSTQAASFFSVRGMFAIFIRVSLVNHG